MQSPFPGMDPWLELHWGSVHARLITYISDQISEKLPEPLVSRPEESVLVDLPAEPAAWVRPDVAIAEAANGAAEAAVGTLAPPMRVAEPLLMRVPEPEVHRNVEIIDPSSGGRVITVIEVLSPSNKAPGRARMAYQSKQRVFIEAGVNLVEIDLLRKGQRTFSMDEALLETKSPTPYMVCVFRGNQVGVRELYLLPLREPLPGISIPLRPEDRDVRLDLQQLLQETYRRGRYDRTDYARPLDPPLAPEDAAWAAELLRRAGRLSS